MKIAMLLVASLFLFTGSLFLVKVVHWGYLVPWFFVGIGFLSLLFIRLSKRDIRDAAGSENFGEILLNSLGLVVIVIGYMSNQLVPSILFLVEVWLIIIHINKIQSRISTNSPSDPR